MLRTLRLAVFLLLVTSWGAPSLSALAEEPLVGLGAAPAEPRLSPGRALDVTLEEDTYHRVVGVPVRSGTRNLHVVLSAPVDVDLALDAQKRLEMDEVSESAWRGESWLGIEHVIVAPPSGEAFAEDALWWAHIIHPGWEGRGTSASVIAYEERAHPVLAPQQTTVLTMPAGESQLVRAVLLPNGLRQAVVQAESAGGRPRMRLERGGVVLPAAPRGHGASVRLGAPTPSGVWQLVVERPLGMALDLDWRVSVHLSLSPLLPDLEALQPKEARPLAGPLGDRIGTLEFELGVDDVRDVYLDVGLDALALEVHATFEEGDVDLYAARDVPAEATPGGNWIFAAWNTADREKLLLGGDQPLPMGRWWIRLSHESGEAGTVQVYFRTHEEVLDDSEIPTSRGTLGDDVVWQVDFEAGESIAWWDLAPTVGPGTHLQVLASDKDVDLLVARRDTGAVLLHATSDAPDEYLQIPENLVLPQGAGLRVGVGRWQLKRPVVAGELHVSTGTRTLPPPAYYPPYAGFPDGPRGRTLAGSVAVHTDDGSGTGVLVSPTGLLVTCEHVVEDVRRGGKVRIAFPTALRGRPRQVFLAEVIDKRVAEDLALLKIVSDLFGRPRDGARPLPFVPLGSSRDMQLEDPVRAVGYGSAGSSSFDSNLTVFHGILAAVETEGGEDRWLVTAARMGPGNSGSGLFDAYGRIVAVHSRTFGGSGTQLSYCRPVDALPAAWRERIAAEGGLLP